MLSDSQISQLKALTMSSRMVAWRDGDRFRRVVSVGPRKEAGEDPGSEEPAATLEGGKGEYVSLLTADPADFVELRVTPALKDEGVGRGKMSVDAAVYTFGARTTPRGAVAWMRTPSGRLLEKRYRSGYASALLRAGRWIREQVDCLLDEAAIHGRHDLVVVDTRNSNGVSPDGS